MATVIDSYVHMVAWTEQEKLVSMWIVAVLPSLCLGTLGRGFLKVPDCVREDPYFQGNLLEVNLSSIFSV